MYSFYLDYLKSFKAFIASVFPGIEHYQFNYADKAYLNYKLYDEHVQEYPMCIINLTDITTEDNKDFFRYIGMKYSTDTLALLASNHTQQSSVIMDFKWVTIQTQVRINLASTAELLDYHNQLISAFPKSFMFYSYRYNSYIPIDDYVTGWDPADDTEGLYYRAIDDTVQPVAVYNIEPLFRVNSITKNKVVGDDISLDISLEVRLKVPNYIGSKSIDNRIVNGIQVIVDMGTNNTDNPILIDMNNDIYSDRKGKLVRGYLLTQGNFDIVNNTVVLDTTLYDLTDKHIGIYMVDDSTAAKPKVYWTEGLVTIDDIVGTDYVITLDDTLSDFQFSPMSNLQVMVFNDPI